MSDYADSPLGSLASDRAEIRALRAALEAAERERDDARVVAGMQEDAREEQRSRAETAERQLAEADARVMAAEAERDALRERAEALQRELDEAVTEADNADSAAGEAIHEAVVLGRERDEARKWANTMEHERDWERDVVQSELRLQLDALREQVEAAREALAEIAANGPLDALPWSAKKAKAALARLDLQETGK